MRAVLWNVADFWPVSNDGFAVAEGSPPIMDGTLLFSEEARSSVADDELTVVLQDSPVTGSGSPCGLEWWLAASLPILMTSDQFLDGRRESE